MSALLISFLAGILTVAAPCVLPLLPVIIGGSVVDSNGKKSSPLSPYVLILGLVLSVILFSLLLKASTALLGIPQSVWQIVSGGIILLFGLHFLFPNAWATISTRLGLQKESDDLLQHASRKRGLTGDFLMGAALGPVFNSCSPTYALIVAIILPRSFGEGIAHLTAYSLGLGIVLLAISLLGRTAVSWLRPLANPNGSFRKTIGIIFIAVAIFVITGYDKKAQAYVLERGWYDAISNIEHELRK